MNIRLATIDDLDKINELFKRVIKDMYDKKTSIWNDFYPFCEFEKNIADKEMYVLENDEKIIGSFALNVYDDPDYNNIKWKYRDTRFFYLNRLVIDVDYQGKGYSKNAMDYIENYARENKYEVIRLSVHIDNNIAISLYERNGFEKIEDFVLNLYDIDFIFYEKEIKNNKKD